MHAGKPAVAAVAALLIVLAVASAPATGFGGPELQPAGSPRSDGPAAARLRPYRSEVSKLDGKARKRMTGVSWQKGCPVGLGDLRLVSVSYVDFGKHARQGKLVIHEDHAKDIARVFERLYEKRFRIRRIELIDRYRGSDHRSMDADNTSAFNCRVVAGTDRWSRHAYGTALDLNPVENPYVTTGGHVSPPAGAAYTDRGDVRKGMVEDGPVVKSFQKIAGWEWGGEWSGTKDYQHFSSDGR